MVKYYSLKEAGKVLGLSRPTLMKHIKTLEIKPKITERTIVLKKLFVTKESLGKIVRDLKPSLQTKTLPKLGELE